MPDKDKQMDLSDHDLLTKLAVSTETLCKQVKDLHASNTADHDKIEKMIQKNADDVWNEFARNDKNCDECKQQFFDKMLELKGDKVPWGNFKWIVGGLAGAFLAALIFIGTMAVSNTQAIEKMIIAIDKLQVIAATEHKTVILERLQEEE